jgi:hypothetical protein
MYLKLQILLKINMAQTSQMKQMKQMMQIISFKYIIIVKVGLKVKSKRKNKHNFEKETYNFSIKTIIS